MTFFAVVVCDAINLPVILHSTHSSPENGTHYGSVVQYECLEGYRFQSGDTVAVVTCYEDGSWQPDINHCQGNDIWIK